MVFSASILLLRAASLSWMQIAFAPFDERKSLSSSMEEEACVGLMRPTLAAGSGVGLALRPPCP
jgi:hypothetical protein